MPDDKSSRPFRYMRIARHGFTVADCRKDLAKQMRKVGLYQSRSSDHFFSIGNDQIGGCARVKSIALKTIFRARNPAELLRIDNMPCAKKRIELRQVFGFMRSSNESKLHRRPPTIIGER
ncbi:hypothetical protein JP75_07500 [Devosia riboflavina]|uniref:Uncharacterized protein n=1 Tax=Devosia riboflavina TaxID=46914 RepID=A0A087M3E7_9HYPH|nr:hypothetical protein JP75_07500 [Devosia riboflavina]